jgi:hypothetical protein
MTWNMRSESFEAGARRRFWARVQKSEDGCWLWTGLKDKDGYGVFAYKYRNHRPHRLAFQWEHGPIVGIVRHSCDTPARMSEQTKEKND